MEELARRRAELIMVEEEVKAKADGSARRKRRIGRMLAEAEGDCRSPGSCCCCSNRTRLHALRVEKSSRDADDEMLRSFVEQMLEPRVVARYEEQGLPVCVFVAKHVDV